MSRTISFLLALAAIGCATLALVGVAAYSFLNNPASTSDEVAVFEVKPGDGFKTIAKRLEETGLIGSAFKLELYARLTGAGRKVKMGEYAIRRSSTPAQVLEVISSGRSIEYVITIQEGFNKFEIAELLERQNVATKKDFLALVDDPAFVKETIGESLPTLEGYLFPETYHVTKFTGAKGLVKMMADRFKGSMSRLTLPTHPGTGRQMTRHELVTLASIIEKETGAPEERPLISSVFHNRLRLGMRMQTDPTVIYGIWEKTGVWNRNITKNDLLTPSRYNTYTMAGLPPGPISNPGAEALKAATLPANSEFLFFVSRNDGTHIFSKDYGGHQKAVTKFQIDRKAREGKSWRDLQKRQQASPDGVRSGNKKAAAPRP